MVLEKRQRQASICVEGDQIDPCLSIRSTRPGYGAALVFRQGLGDAANINKPREINNKQVSKKKNVPLQISGTLVQAVSHATILCKTSYYTHDTSDSCRKLGKLDEPFIFVGKLCVVKSVTFRFGISTASNKHVQHQCQCSTNCHV